MNTDTFKRGPRGRSVPRRCMGRRSSWIALPATQAKTSLMTDPSALAFD